MIPVPQTGNNWNFNALLVRMQNGIGILENTLAVPYEICSSHDLTISPSGYHREIKIYAHTKIYTSKSIHNCPKLETTQISFHE